MTVSISTSELVALKLRIEEIGDRASLDILLLCKLFFHVLKRASFLVRVESLAAADVASFGPSFLRR